MKCLAIFFGLATLTPPVWAQGNDCSSPIAIQGEVTQGYNSLGFPSTTFGQGTACDWQGASRSYETFYQWSALADGDYIISLDALFFIPALAVYEGSGCSAVCFGSVAGPSSSSSVAFELVGVQAGETYLLHCASLGFGDGIGVLDVALNPCTPAAVYDDGFEPNDQCSEAVVLGQGTYAGLWTSVPHPDFYEVSVPPLSRLRVLTLPLGNQAQLAFGISCTSNLLPENQVDWKNLSLETKSVWVRVTPKAASECADYDLVVSWSALPCTLPSIGDTVLEPNDTCAQAQLVTPGTYLGLWGSAGSLDFYAVDVPPGQGVALEMLNHDSHLVFGLNTESCQSLPMGSGAGSFPQLGPINQTGVVQRIVFFPMFNAGPGWPDCDSYGFTLSLYDEICDPSDEDVLDRPLYGAALEQPIGNGEYDGLTLRAGGDQYVLCAPPGGSVRVEFEAESLLADVDGFLCNSVQQPICYLSSQFGTGPMFTLQYDNNGPTAEKVYLLLRSPGFPECVPYQLYVTGSGGCLDFVEFAAFCDPGLPNPDGRSTRLMATQEWLLDWQVKWDAVNGPVGEFGYLVGGTWFQDPGIPISLGQLCLLGAAPGRLARYNVVGSPFDSIGYFDAHGRFVNSGQTSDSDFGYLLPPTTPWGSPFAPGEAHYFQLWHRAPGGQSNLSNGVKVAF